MTLRARYRVVFGLVAAMLVSLQGHAYAQHATVQLSVDRRLVAPGETIAITVQVVIQGRAGYERYLPPQMKGFRQLGRGQSSQVTEVINWDVRRRETYRYHAAPIKEGSYAIGPAAVQLNGRWVRSAAVKVTVRKGAGGTSVPVSPGTAAQGTPPSSAAGAQIDPRGVVLPAGELPTAFIALQVRPTEVYVGQQIVATWKLYTESDVIGFRSNKQPTTDGFWAEELNSPRRLRPVAEQLRGRRFSASVLVRKALFPQLPGSLTIGTMEASVRTMHHFQRSVRIASLPYQIKVKPLPKAGRPKGFSDQNVGRFAMVASLDRDRVKAGEAVRFELVVRGGGNLKQLTLPKLAASQYFKVYEPKEKTNIRNVHRIEGERVIEYIVLPKKAGRLTIPALTLHYFDPMAGRYRRARTRSLVLNVTGAVVGAKGGVKGQTNVIGRDDIRPPRRPRSLQSRTSLEPLSPIYLGLFAFPLTVLLILGIKRRLHATLNRETARSLSRAAARKVRERLSKAREAKKANDGRLFTELAAALNEQLAHSLRERVEGMTRDELREEMRLAGYSDSLVAEIVAELDGCDFARFAASASDPGEREAAYQRVADLLARVAAGGERGGRS